jgi:hypothetical protein
MRKAPNMPQPTDHEAFLRTAATFTSGPHRQMLLDAADHMKALREACEAFSKAMRAGEQPELLRLIEALQLTDRALAPPASTTERAIPFIRYDEESEQPEC